MKHLVVPSLAVLLLALGAPLAADAGPPTQAQAAAVAPLRSFTTPTEARGVSVQPGTGDLLVSGGDGTIRSYPAGATGDQSGAPLAQGLSGPMQGAFDSTGQLYVPEYSAGDVEVIDFGSAQYSLGLSGLVGPRQVAVDSDDRVYVTSQGNGGEVVVKDPRTGVTTIRGIGTSDLEGPIGVAIGPGERVYVLDQRSSGAVVSVFAPWPNSAGALRTIVLPDSISEPSTLAVDDGGNVYVPNLDGQVVVFGPGASGNATPRVSRQLASSNGPVIALSVISGRRVLLPEFPDGRISTFAPLVPYAKPGRVRSLTVSGAATARSRTISWMRPASVGDRPVTAYVATVRRGGASGTIVRRITQPGGRWTIRTAGLRVGTYTAVVQARSSIGLGPAAARAFPVRRPPRR